MKNHHIKYKLLAVSLLATAEILGNQAHAAIINGDFADGALTGWASVGNVQVQPTVLPGNISQSNLYGPIPAPATHQAILGSGGLGDEYLNSGVSPVSAASLGDFLSLSNCCLGQNGNGSAIQQVFSSVAGDNLSFNWNFLSNALPNNEPKNDFAFLVLDGAITTLANTNTFKSPTGSSYVLDYQTGYNKLLLNLSAGNHTLSFGIIDGGAFDGSALTISNVQINAVPLPAAFWLFLSGMVGVLKYARQTKSVRYVE